MKLFYSELSSNPAYYSFGYSVYGTKEPEDTLSGIYEQGFLPAVVVKDPTDIFYMCRGTRVAVRDFKERHKLGRVARKFDAIDTPIRVTVHERSEFAVTEAFMDFCLNYFNFRHGKGSMPRERLQAILNSPYLTHISEYSIGTETVAYVLEVQTDSLIHSWYYAYAKKYEGKHLGAYLLLDVIRRAKAAGKEHVYLGVTYGTWMQYKTIYEPLEYWNGRNWVHDPKSKQLKRLLAVDHLRALTLADEWRSDKSPYYSAAYAYTQRAVLYRRTSLLLARYPKASGSILILAALMVAYLTYITYLR